MSYGRTPEQIRNFYRQLQERITAVPGVERVAIGSSVPWRDTGQTETAGFGFQVEGGSRGAAGDDPRAKMRSVSPGYFAALGVVLDSGRDFTLDDRTESEKVVVVTRSLATQLFPGRDVINRQLFWTDPVMKFIGVSGEGRRIVGIAADVDDENVVPGPALSVYHPFEQEIGGGRMFVHARTDPYALVPSITRIIREMSADQPVEQAATLEDIRAEVLAPDRLNTLVFGGFAAVALMIAVVGVAGVLAFSVSTRTREFGIRLAVGSAPRHLLTRILGEGAVIAGAGIVAGAAGGVLLAQLVGSYIQDVSIPGALPIAGAAAVLVAAAIVASLMPAARAARIDVIQALRSE
jgi:hypothetical protein